MGKKNLFISYHHQSDFKYLKKLREKLPTQIFSDYGFKEENLEHLSQKKIEKKIQYRLWSSSVIIVLIGENTGSSLWVDWEIYLSLKTFQDSLVKRRRFNPKGLLALYLPVKKHNVPNRLQANLNSGYAIKMDWSEVEALFDEKVSQALKNRPKTHLIDNNFPLKHVPENYFNKLKNFFTKKSSFFKKNKCG